MLIFVAANPVGGTQVTGHIEVVKVAPVDHGLKTGVVLGAIVQTCCACHSYVVPQLKLPNWYGMVMLFNVIQAVEFAP